jgi:hypothetical protein
MSPEELREAFLHAAAGPREGHNAFFNGFKYVHDILHGNPGAGVDQGIHLMTACRSIDNAAYSHVHKGSAFYWLGIGAFLVHDVEVAAFFFDAAVSEDLRAGADPETNPTPALRFLQVEGEPPEQAARDLVRLAQARVEELINNYSARSGARAVPQPLDIAGLRRQFLRPAIQTGREAWRSLVTAFISFALEWDYRNALLDLRPGQGTAEPIFLHLFKGCVLFESLLKANPSVVIPPEATTLGQVLNALHSQLGIGANPKVGNSNLPQIVAELPQADESMQTAIVLTARVRNTIGHNLGWLVAIDNTTYSRLFRMISSSCLHAIAALYP